MVLFLSSSSDLPLDTTQLLHRQEIGRVGTLMGVGIGKCYGSQQQFLGRDVTSLSPALQFSYSELSADRPPLHGACFPVESELSAVHLMASSRLHLPVLFACTCRHGQSSSSLLDRHALQMLGWPDTHCLSSTLEKEEVPQIVMDEVVSLPLLIPNLNTVI